jgi:ketosteroid isomerase-like protein
MRTICSPLFRTGITLPLLGIFILASVVLGLCVLGPAFAASAEVDATTQIRKVLDDQARDWNDGNIDRFVQGYWKSDDTVFVGAGGVKKGFNSILERYKHDYPDKKAMGHLSFSDLEVHLSCADSAYVVGQFQLYRPRAREVNKDGKKENKAGYFTLYLRKIDGHWLIVADNTTAKSN